MNVSRIAGALAAACIVLLWVAPTADAYYRPLSWPERKAKAILFAEDRAGSESFAVVDQSGRLRGYRRSQPIRIASLLKPMLLVAYLNRDSVRDRALTSRERNLLGPMIRWSDDQSAETVLGIVGSEGLYDVARRADMKHFRFRSHWGWSTTTAADQAMFFYRIESFVPARHRRYTRYLLSHIVPSQTWGIPREAPRGWRVFFKGGWSTGTGRVTNQVALLQDGDARVALAILTEHNPSHEYGTRTIRGLASRLLRVPLPGPTPSG